MFSGDAKGLARGDQDLESGRRSDESGNVWGCVEKVLEVVEDQQHLAGGEVVGQGLGQRSPRYSRSPECRAIAPVTKGGIGQGGKLDEEDAVIEGGKQLGSGREREAGLADTAGTSEGHDPDLCQGEQGGELGDVFGASDEGSERGGQVGGVGGGSTGRGEVGSQAWGHHLVQAYGGVDVFEGVLAEITQ